jgi:methanogenic corrinoid protein MtbC1
MQEAVRFIRQTGADVVRPEVLGFERDVLGHSQSSPYGSSGEQAVFEALLSGERRAVKGLILSWYMEGHDLTALLDGPVRVALHQFGELWKHEERGILLEHRATEICMEALLELRALLPSVEAEAPLALGGAPEDDEYLIPSTMAAMVLAEAGYRDINYGGQTPLHLLADAADEHGAALVWISITAPPDKRGLQQQIADLARHLLERKATLLLGGRHAAEVYPKGVANVQLMNSMAELSAFAKGMVNGSKVVGKSS